MKRLQLQRRRASAASASCCRRCVATSGPHTASARTACRRGGGRGRGGLASAAAEGGVGRGCISGCSWCAANGMACATTRLLARHRTDGDGAALAVPRAVQQGLLYGPQPHTLWQPPPQLPRALAAAGLTSAASCTTPSRVMGARHMGQLEAGAPPSSTLAGPQRTSIQRVRQCWQNLWPQGVATGSTNTCRARAGRGEGMRRGVSAGMRRKRAACGRDGAARRRGALATARPPLAGCFAFAAQHHGTHLMAERTKQLAGELAIEDIQDA